MGLLRTQIFPSTSTIKDPTTKNWADKMVRFLDDLIKKIAAIPFNRSESLNVADTGSADTTFTLSHHLGRVPSGLFVTRIDKAGIVYVDSTDFGNWSTTEIKFKCSVANALIKLSVF